MEGFVLAASSVLLEMRARVPAAVTACDGLSSEKGSAGPAKKLAETVHGM